MSVNNPSGGGSLPALITPLASPSLPLNGSTAPTANRVYLNRVFIPKSGTLTSIAVWVATSSGNVQAGVYDTGDAAAGSLSLLSSSGSVACPAGGGWREIYTPDLAVAAGQHLDFAFQSDNGTNIFGRLTMGNGPGGMTLPPGYADAPGGMLTKLIAVHTPGSFGLPATIAEAGIGDPSTAPIVYIIGAVS